MKVNRKFLGLGMLKAPDDRDNKYLIKSILPKKATTRKFRYWNQNSFWGNQLNTAQCVGFSFCHFITDGPITQEFIYSIWPQKIYMEAQKLDPWSAVPHDGTTVRAGAQYLQKLGYIGAYRWAWDLETMVAAVLEFGPVVVGTMWYDGMFYPDADGFIQPTGPEAGGHAYLVNGVNVEQKKIRIKNSWGREWGVNGNAWITFDDFQKLIDNYAEICLATEIKYVKPL